MKLSLYPTAIACVWKCLDEPKILSHFEVNDCMPLDAGRVDKALSVSMGVQDWRFALSTLWKRRQRRPEKTVDLQEATWKVVWPSSTFQYFNKKQENTTS